MVIPYVAELSVRVKRVKDPIPMEKSGVVYEVPCSCGKAYIGETKRTLETRMKEHRAAARLGQLEKSAVMSEYWMSPQELCTADQRSPAHPFEAHRREDH